MACKHIKNQYKQYEVRPALRQIKFNHTEVHFVKFFVYTLMKWIMENTYLILCTNSNKIDHFYTLRLFVVGDLTFLFVYLQLIYSQPTLVYVCWKFACNVNSRVIWSTLTDINNWYRIMYPNILMAYFPMRRAQSVIRERPQRKHVCTVEDNVFSHAKKIWTPEDCMRGKWHKQNISIKYFMIGRRTKSGKKNYKHRAYMNKCWNIKF